MISQPEEWHQLLAFAGQECSQRQASQPHHAKSCRWVVKASGKQSWNRHPYSDITVLKAYTSNDGYSGERLQPFCPLQQAVRAPPVLWCLLTWSVHA